MRSNEEVDKVNLLLWRSEFIFQSRKRTLRELGSARDHKELISVARIIDFHHPLRMVQYFKGWLCVALQF